MLTAVRRNPWLKAFYERLRAGKAAQGRPHRRHAQAARRRLRRRQASQAVRPAGVTRAARRPPAADALARPWPARRRAAQGRSRAQRGGAPAPALTGRTRAGSKNPLLHLTVSHRRPITSRITALTMRTSKRSLGQIAASSTHRRCQSRSQIGEALHRRRKAAGVAGRDQEPVLALEATVSRQPGPSVVIIGRPVAIASRSVRGIPSRYEGRTKTGIAQVAAARPASCRDIRSGRPSPCGHLALGQRGRDRVEPRAVESEPCTLAPKRARRFHEFRDPLVRSRRAISRNTGGPAGTGVDAKGRGRCRCRR